VRGSTTDVSALYPRAIAEIFGPVPRQVCEFHVLADLSWAVLRAVAKVRKTLAAPKPKLPRDRPSKYTRALDRKAKRLEQKTRTCSAVGAGVGDLFQHRYLFVQGALSPSEQKTLQRTPHLRWVQVSRAGCRHCEPSRRSWTTRSERAV
jgi:hypothetical protein